MLAGAGGWNSVLSSSGDAIPSLPRLHVVLSVCFELNEASTPIDFGLIVKAPTDITSIRVDRSVLTEAKKAWVHVVVSPNKQE